MSKINNSPKSATGGNAQGAKIDFALGKIYKELDNDLINNSHADI